MKKHIFSLTSLFVLLIFLCILISHSAQAQTDKSFAGTYKNDLYGTTLILAQGQGGLQGVLSTGYMNFSVTANPSNGQLTGKVMHGKGQALPWSARWVGDQLMVDAYGGQNAYKKISSDTQISNQETLASPQAQRLAGSRLYWYRDASIIASSGGAYGEIDLCPDGTFHDYSESSVMVKAGPDNYNREYYDQMGSAGYASNSRSSGYWTIVNYQGVPYVAIQYTSGASYSTPLSQVMGGVWYVGKTKYAMDWGKGKCR